MEPSYSQEDLQRWLQLSAERLLEAEALWEEYKLKHPTDRAKDKADLEVLEQVRQVSSKGTEKN